MARISPSGGGCDGKEMDPGGMVSGDLWVPLSVCFIAGFWLLGRKILLLCCIFTFVFLNFDTDFSVFGR